jgi:hypothetical protein
MFVVEIPEIPTERAQLVLAQTDAENIRRNSQSSLRPTRAQSSSIKKVPSLVKADKILWFGQTVEQDGGPNMPDGVYAQGRILSNPNLIIVSDLMDSRWLKANGITAESKANTIVEILPKHGKLEAIANSEYQYTPNKGYLGKDLVSFVVTVDGKKIRVKFTLYIVKEIIEEKAQNEAGAIDLAFNATTLAAWQKSSDLMNHLADASQSFTGFSDLAGTAVGQAAGINITLDTNATGHGWFVDTTPNDNEEFLATSNPNVWIARAGSAADGKMDMLSVLLHEYGQVLGLDHSTVTGDALSAVLQPGVRKLWSETDLAKLNLATAA